MAPRFSRRRRRPAEPVAKQERSGTAPDLAKDLGGVLRKGRHGSGLAFERFAPWRVEPIAGCHVPIRIGVALGGGSPQHRAPRKDPQGLRAARQRRFVCCVSRHVADLGNRCVDSIPAYIACTGPKSKALWFRRWVRPLIRQDALSSCRTRVQ